jgi:hypothetical protein
MGVCVCVYVCVCGYEGVSECMNIFRGNFTKLTKRVENRIGVKSEIITRRAVSMNQ